MTGRSPESFVFGEFRFVPSDGLWRNGRTVPLPPRAIGVLSIAEQAAFARYSPTGHIVFERHGHLEAAVYVRAATGDGSRVRVSAGGGVWPCWSLDGKTVYFSANGRTMASAMQTSGALAASAPVSVPGADAMVLEWFRELTRRS